MQDLVNYEHEAVKSLLNSKQTVYDYLSLKKHHYLDGIESRAMTNKFLDGILKGSIWCPINDLSNAW